VHKRIISAVRKVEFVSDRTSYIILNFIEYPSLKVRSVHR
jgi:hypothetical protein